MSLIERYTTNYVEDLTCKWCGLPLANDDYVYGGDIVCKGCYEMANRGSTAIDYLIHLLKDGQLGSVHSFLQDLKNIDEIEEIGAWIRGYFDEDYEKWVKF